MIYFSDNGETACINASDVHVCDDTVPQFIFSYKFSEFFGTRTAANKKSAPVYTLPKIPYGIAHKGVVDLNSETYPVSIKTSTGYETPQI